MKKTSLTDETFHCSGTGSHKNTKKVFVRNWFDLVFQLIWSGCLSVVKETRAAVLFIIQTASFSPYYWQLNFELSLFPFSSVLCPLCGLRSSTYLISFLSSLFHSHFRSISHWGGMQIFHYSDWQKAVWEEECPGQEQCYQQPVTENAEYTRNNDYMAAQLETEKPVLLKTAASYTPYSLPRWKQVVKLNCIKWLSGLWVPTEFLAQRRLP